jgi:hypothetical protein
MKNLHWFILFSCILMLDACSKTNHPPDPAILTGWIQSPSIDVYAAGIEDSSGIYNLKYWKNGVGIPLPNHAGAGNYNIIPVLITTGIMVYRNDVFVCGNDYYPSTNKYVATYWKNGIPIALGDGSADTWASAIAVSGNDVYVAGYSTANNKTFAIWWKNGIRMVLGDSTFSGTTTSILVSGDDIYITGAQSRINDTTASFGGDPHNIAVYWKNSTRVFLGDSSVEGIASSISISGNDVYVAGYNDYGYSGSDSINAKYWKNGSEIKLQSATLFATASAIAVSGNDVYVAGNSYTPIGVREFADNAQYWNNGNLVSLTMGSYISITSAIAVSGTDVYVAGANNDEPAIWKNGVSTSYSSNGKTYTNGGQYTGFIYSIYLSKP